MFADVAESGDGSIFNFKILMLTVAGEGVDDILPLPSR